MTGRERARPRGRAPMGARRSDASVAERLANRLRQAREAAVDARERRLVDRLSACFADDSWVLGRRPGSAERLAELLDGERVDTRLVARVVGRDAELTLRVLGLATPGAPRPLEQVVRELGPDVLWRVGVYDAASEPAWSAPGHETRRLQAVALITSSLASYLAPAQKGLAEQAGLLVDVGTLAVLRWATPADREDLCEPVSVARVARALHPASSAMVALARGMRPEVVLVLAHASGRGQAPVEVAAVARAVGAAHVMARHACEVDQRSSSELSDELRFLGVSAGDRQRLQYMGERARDRVADLLD